MKSEPPLRNVKILLLAGPENCLLHEVFQPGGGTDHDETDEDESHADTEELTPVGLDHGRGDHREEDHEEAQQDEDYPHVEG